MSWINLTGLTTSKDWVYSKPFVSNVIRIRHFLNVPNSELPYRFYGYIGQAFNYPSNIELLGVRKLYPSNLATNLVFTNPFPDRERRIVIKGQLRHYADIQWSVLIDVWQKDNLTNAELNIVELSENSLDRISEKVAKTTTEQIFKQKKDTTAPFFLYPGLP